MDFTGIHQRFIDVRDAWMKDGAPLIDLPEREVREDDFEYVNASAFSSCPKLAAYERLRKPTKFEAQELGWLSYRGMAGTALAHLWQSAFKWYWGDLVLIEHYTRSPATYVKGYADVVFLPGTFHPDKPVVIEIKSRELGHKRELRLSDAWQAHSYAVNLDTNYHAIMTINWGDRDTNGMNLWGAVHAGDGWSYRNQRGHYFNGPWNHVGMLNDAGLFDVVARHLTYLQGEETPPIADPFNHPESWHCIEWEVYPSKATNGDGVAVNNCPVGCHFETVDQRISVSRGSDGRLVPVDSIIF